jgi:hypothetical protein
MQILAQMYQQGSAAAVREALAGKLDDAAIEAIIRRLAGDGG